MFRQFPIAVVDNFFDDPYKIRKFALSCEYTKAPGNYPGERTKMLSEIYPKYFNSFCNRLFSLFYYYEPNPNVVWNVETMFQKIYPLDDDKLSPLNSGWIHSDDETCMAAGVIYLNPNSNLDAGTSFYKLKDDVFNTLHVNYKLRNDLYANKKVDHDSYKKELDKLEGLYDKTLEVKNVFNRMAFYGSDIHHKENNFVASDNEPRLTQVFFVHKIQSNLQRSPLPRLQEYGIEF
tara:strand:+ start:1108 stop:1809 length:702 start_codon:yes stop_codon:yes gene_type:complete